MGAEYAGTAGRLILGGFFLVAGIANLVTPGSILDHIDRMRAYGTPAPAVASGAASACSSSAPRSCSRESAPTSARSA